MCVTSCYLIRKTVLLYECDFFIYFFMVWMLWGDVRGLKVAFSLKTGPWSLIRHQLTRENGGQVEGEISHENIFSCNLKLFYKWKLPCFQCYVFKLLKRLKKEVGKWLNLPNSWTSGLLNSSVFTVFQAEVEKQLTRASRRISSHEKAPRTKRSWYFWLKWAFSFLTLKGFCCCCCCFILTSKMSLLFEFSCSVMLSWNEKPSEAQSQLCDILTSDV